MDCPTALSVNRLIAIDFRKWVTRPHWKFNMYWLAEDEWGLWLWTPAGSTAQRGYDPPQTFNRNNVKLVVPGEWWTAIWNDGGQFDLYIDVITPPAIGQDRVTMVDLDLDVVRTVDGTTTVEDEDEFLEHQVRYAYSDYVVRQAQEATAAVAARVECRDEPFGEVGDRMMAMAKAASFDLGI